MNGYTWNTANFTPAASLRDAQHLRDCELAADRSARTGVRLTAMLAALRGPRRRERVSADRAAVAR